MDRIDQALIGNSTSRTAADYYGDPSEYPDCPMPDWLKQRLGLPPDDRLVAEAATGMRAAAMGYRTEPTTEHIRRGLAPDADAAATYAALSRWLAPRSPHQMMAGWAAGLYTPRQVTAKAIEHGFRTPGLRNQLRCVRARKPTAPGAAVPWNVAPEPPTLKLPEPARTLYLRQRALIDAWTSAAGLRPDQVALGGGSVLAALWTHRRSDDIDIVVQGRAAYAEMLAIREKLTLLARDYGGTVLWVPRIQGVRVTWPNPRLGRDNKLEFFGEANRPPAHNERTIDLEGSPTRTLGVVQILWGKLDRSVRAEILPKDVFDIRQAGRSDPEALATAVNAWPASTMREFAQALRSDAAVIGEDIEAQIWTEPRLQPGAGGPIAEQVADSIERALYLEVTIGIEKGLVRVDRTTVIGPLPPFRWPADETGVEVERTGIARHLDTLGMSVVADDAVSVAGRSGGAARLWTARDGDILEWKRPPEALRAMAESSGARASTDIDISE